MDTNQIAKIRYAVKRAKKSSGLRVRYPRALKSQVVELLQSGMKPTEVARLTGLSSVTLFKWSRASQAVAKGFRRVKATAMRSLPDKARSAEFRISLPNGITIECSSCSAVREILEAMA